MNILVYDCNGSFIINDVVYTLNKLGHSCKSIQRIVTDKYGDEEFSSEVRKELTEAAYDAVFTTNYYPVISRVCHEKEIPYFSWVYDSPPEIPDTVTMDYPTNRIFFFCRYDRDYYRNKLGLDNIYYMPLAVNTERLAGIIKDPKYEADVSLVGGLYHSKLLEYKKIMSEEQQKYLDAVLLVQQKSVGSFVIDSALTDEFVESVCQYYKLQSENAVQPSKEVLFYAACAHLTHMDRLALLRLCAGKGYKTKIYLRRITAEDRSMLEDKNVEVGPYVSYLEEMPKVFMGSKINLCPTLRANRTGIPLRVVDVLGVGGFLLTTHQAELDDFFYGDEIVTYDSLEEAMDKIDYYLAHDEERKIIAQKGHQRAIKDFSYEDRLTRIFSVKEG